jgi:hypothetical protein
MKKPKPAEQTQVRMPPALKERVRKYQMRVQQKTGVQVSWSAAVRALIERSLELDERGLSE